MFILFGKGGINVNRILSFALALFLIFGLAALPGCRRPGEENVSTKATSGDTQSSEPSTQSSEPPTENTTPPTDGSEPPAAVYPMIDVSVHVSRPPILPFPKEDAPRQEWIVFFYALLSQNRSWYNMALEKPFSDPKMINVAGLFYNGIPGNDMPLTPEESAFLEAKGYIPALDFTRVPIEGMESVLQIYFGIELENVIDKEMPGMYLFEKTNCYYKWGGGVNSQQILAVTGYEVLPNGDFAVNYIKTDFSAADNKIAGQVVLRRVEEYLQVVSNTFL